MLALISYEKIGSGLGNQELWVRSDVGAVKASVDARRSRCIMYGQE